LAGSLISPRVMNYS